jgi:hypothetical protein
MQVPNNEASIPTEIARNGPRMSGKMGRKDATWTCPWSNACGMRYLQNSCSERPNLRLLFIYPCFHSSDRCWDPRDYAICSYTDFSFDPEPELQLQPNLAILVTVRLSRMLQLIVFFFCPCTNTSIRLADAGIQGRILSVITLFLRSTLN